MQDDGERPPDAAELGSHVCREVQTRFGRQCVRQFARHEIRQLLGGAALR
jgi:hypothetical protein